MDHDIDAKRIHISDSMAKKVRKWPAHMNEKELFSFMQFIQFLAKSLKGYAKIAKPLTKSGKEKNPWQWTEAKAEAFEALNDAVNVALSLHIIHPKDANASFDLHLAML